jgi:hypothetical protein
MPRFVPSTIFPESALAALVATATLLPACGGCDGAPPPRAGHDAGRAPGAVSAAAPAPRPPPDPRFERARAGDEIALGRLAEQLGADGLLPWVRVGGADGALALRAMEHAVDAELALGELASRAHAGPPLAERRQLLRTILSIAGRRPEPVEALDPQSVALCIEHLQALSRDAASPRELRSLAVSALRALAHAGHLSHDAVTDELDR